MGGRGDHQFPSDSPYPGGISAQPPCGAMVPAGPGAPELLEEGLADGEGALAQHLRRPVVVVPLQGGGGRGGGGR